MFRAIKRYLHERKTISALSRLTDRELNDIGIGRSEIYMIARQKAFDPYA